MQVSVGVHQGYLKRHLIRALEASRLVHLRPGGVRLSGETTLTIEIEHAAKPDVVLRIFTEPDGSGLIECEALEPEFHVHFDPMDQAFAVEVALLVLHGWATVRTELERSGRLMASVVIESPGGNAVFEELYETRTGVEGTRTVSWGSSRDPRVQPPSL
jgi:hypothetical protein